MDNYVVSDKVVTCTATRAPTPVRKRSASAGAMLVCRAPNLPRHNFHMQTLIIYKLGFKQNYYTFTLILLIKIVLCSEFP